VTSGARRTVGLAGAALAVLIGGIGWISISALRLERSEARARERAAVEEAVRLALWRMDSAVTPLLVREQAGAQTGLAGARSFVVADFTIDDEGLAPPAGASAMLLDRLSHLSVAQVDGNLAMEIQKERDVAVGNAESDGPAPAHQGDALKEEEQSYRNSIEWSARAKSVKAQTIEYAFGSAGAEHAGFGAASNGLDAGWADDALLRPIWVGGELVLARRVAGAAGAFQVVLLDWPALEKHLLGQVADLLPRAHLEPVFVDPPGRGAQGPAPAAEERRLASLPVSLLPGAPAAAAMTSGAKGGGAPVVLTLGVAWGAGLLAVAAVILLLIGVVALSERRAVFVSAVTHELRTPLTTFRSYTEMLAKGMVPEGSRAEYLETLRREADRLAHLVENVLLYSRLERGRGGAKLEEVELDPLLERILPRLEGRAAQAGMTIDLAPAAAVDLRMRGDATAIEQVLFNLVDNACKYAAGAEDKRIHLTANGGREEIVIEVRDHGPGIPPADARRLFRPFSRSARDAAGRAPGVGLGLALSRRLARAMGGELELIGGEGAGATFRLTLPAEVSSAG
jgi:signal transduction histidine kinase